MKEEIKQLVSQNQTSEALSLLLDMSKENAQIYDAVLIVSGEFKNLAAQRVRGTIANDEVIRRTNIINDKILIALESFRDDGTPFPSRVASKKEKAKKLILQIGLGLVAGGILVMGVGNYIFYGLENRNAGNYTEIAGLFILIGGVISLAIWLLSVFVNSIKD